MTNSVLEQKKKLRAKRKLRVRGKIFGVANKPRVSVFKSNCYLYAQAINDENGTTLASVNGKKLGLGNNKEDAQAVAKVFAENLKKAGISEAVFDRNGYIYHGVIASFAQALRENGIVL